MQSSVDKIVGLLNAGVGELALDISGNDDERWIKSPRGDFEWCIHLESMGGIDDYERISMFYYDNKKTGFGYLRLYYR
jgi:hypothetical protein